MVSEKKKSIAAFRPKGIAAHYISQSKAIAKLQVSLKDFRRLCILKGVYPRDPSKKPGGRSKVYYAVKDIQFLAHEPILESFRKMKTWLKKLKRAVGRREHAIAEHLEENRPVYSLDHLVRERYPTFESALEDLEDALCMVHLFASLPSSFNERPVIEDCQRLRREWQWICAERGLVRKVFFSVKGVYVSSSIRGRTIVWIMPHENGQQLRDASVDYHVMVTFLEFYRVMLKFVLFRLFAEGGYAYPPRTDPELDAQGKFLGSVVAKPLEDREDAAAAAFGDASRLFSGLTFSISRECPLLLTEFLVLSFGGRVASTKVTHVVCDRPAVPVSLQSSFPTADFVQPQWIADCINTGILVPVHEYRCGTELPPHLSPFVNDEKNGYVPDRAVQLQRMVAVSAGRATSDADALGEKRAAPATLMTAELPFAPKKAKAAAAGHDASENAPAEEEQPPADNRGLRRLMLSRKKQKLYDAMQKGIERKRSEANRLLKAKKRLSTAAKTEKTA